MKPPVRISFLVVAEVPMPSLSFAFRDHLHVDSSKATRSHQPPSGKPRTRHLEHCLSAFGSLRFDIAYVSAGGLGWLPDLQLFFEKAAA